MVKSTCFYIRILLDRRMMDNKEKKLQTSNDDLIEQLLSQAQTNDEVSLNSAKSNDLDDRLNNSLDDDYKKQKIKQMYEEEMERTIDIY